MAGSFPWPTYEDLLRHGARGLYDAGRGHVVCHNEIGWFWDAISTAHVRASDIEPEWAVAAEGAQHAIDIYNNDMHLMADDFIEADGGVHNIRILRNRGVNAAQCGYSAQPVYGGPAYYIRNLAYHVPTGCGGHQVVR